MFLVVGLWYFACCTLLYCTHEPPTEPLLNAKWCLTYHQVKGSVVLVDLLVLPFLGFCTVYILLLYTVFHRLEPCLICNPGQTLHLNKYNPAQ